jgi:hypothetical protein
MKNTFKTQALLVLLMLLGVRSLVAMDNGQDGKDNKKRGLEEECEESSLKRVRSAEQMQEEIIVFQDDLIEEKGIESRVDWNDFVRRIQEDDVFGAIEKYLPVMSRDACDFDYLAIVGQEYYCEDTCNAFVEKYGSPLLKAIVRDDCECVKQLLQSGAIVLAEHVFYELYVGNGALFSLLLQHAKPGIFDVVRSPERELMQSLVESIFSKRPLGLICSDPIEYLECLKNYGYVFRCQDCFYAMAAHFDEVNSGDFCSYKTTAVKFLIDNISDFPDNIVVLLQQLIGNQLWDADVIQYILNQVDGWEYQKNIHWFLIERIYMLYAFEQDPSLEKRGLALMSVLNKACKITDQEWGTIQKQLSLQARLFVFIFKNEVKEVEKLLMLGVDPNMYEPSQGSLLAFAAVRGLTNCFKLLLMYGAHMSEDVISASDNREYSLAVTQCIETVKRMQNFSSENSIDVQSCLDCLKDDYVSKQSCYFQIMLQHPKSSQCLLMCAPYQWLHKDLKTYVFDKEKNQICEKSHQEWFKCELVKNARKLDENGLGSSDLKKVSVLFFAGKHLQQRLHDKKFGDVVIRTSK